jgi:hypothetical protein
MSVLTRIMACINVCVDTHYGMAWIMPWPVYMSVLTRIMAWPGIWHGLDYGVACINVCVDTL